MKQFATAAAPAIQRKCACGGDCSSCKRKEERVLQRKAVAPGPVGVPATATSVLHAPGAPLDGATRGMFESRFGRSFADVRVHADTSAARAAQSIDAAAYTAGSHIVFGAGRYEPHSERGRRLLAHELTHVVQQHGAALPAGVGPADDVHEREADRVAERVAFGDSVQVAPRRDRMIRRQTEEAADAAATPDRLIVDDAEQAGAGQLRRQDFLDELHTAICAVADTEMARLGQSTAGCPVLSRWQSFAHRLSAARLETAIRRFVGRGVASAHSAHDLVPLVSRRVAEGIQEWGRSGTVPQIPPELAIGLGRMTLSAGALISGFLGGIHFKANAGGASGLCPFLGLQGGRPLGGDATRMESAFGRSFSGVRVHTDSASASAVARANARAFTVGRDIAFAAGEYQPGTPIGDALLAHELAHVVQQDGAPGDVMMEQDADDAAVGVVTRLWRGAAATPAARGRLKSGLRLQFHRCKNNPPAQSAATQAVAQQQAPPASRTEAALTLACPPTLGNPRWTVVPQPRFQPNGPRCSFTLSRGMARDEEEFALNGMEFHGAIGVAPNCQGRVYFLQFVEMNRVTSGCVVHPYAFCQRRPWGVDTSQPYASGSVIDLAQQSGTVPIRMFDSPGILNISGSSPAKVCYHDRFVSYIVYEPPGGAALQSLGWLSWQVDATAERHGAACPAREEPGCGGWALAPGSSARKTGESFAAGSQSPDRSLDPTLPVNGTGMVVATDCDPSPCPVGSGP